jgi:hypothetical protein
MIDMMIERVTDSPFEVPTAGASCHATAVKDERDDVRGLERLFLQGQIGFIAIAR